MFNWPKYLLLLLLLTLLSPVISQDRNSNQKAERPLTRILFVFDASQSMYGRWQSDLKINIAREILSKVLDSLRTMGNVEVALRVYGHQHKYPPQVCTDTRLEVPFGRDNFSRIKNRLNSIVPKGTSPIAHSLELTARDFPSCENCRNIIVLITDGIEECDGDPCEVSEKLQKEGVILKPFIVGIGKNFAQAFDCVGDYFDAANEAQFGQALNVVISRVMNPTTAQVNLLDAYGRPTETNVNMTFYDNITGKIRYNYIHTMNSMGLPDTLVIDPLVTYDIVVHTLPPVKADSIHLNSGIHNIIPVSVPQGFMNLKLASQSSVFRELKCIVRRQGSMETINVQSFGNVEKYITGTYHLEVLSLPRMHIENVKLSQNQTTIVEIPTPGIAVIQKSTRGYGSLYVEKENQLEWVYNFRDVQQTQESLVLMPGTYRAIFRSRYADRSIYTIEKSFVVKSGLTTNVKLNDY
jgi:Ca-activated chloride channel family protein